MLLALLLALGRLTTANAQTTDPRSAALMQQLTAAPDASARENLYSANQDLLTPAFVDAFNKTGHDAGNGGNISGALRIYDIGCELANRIEYARGKASCLYNTGMVSFRKNNFPDAEAKFQAAVIAFQAAGDHDFACRALENIALIYRFRNDFPSAVAYYNRAEAEAAIAKTAAVLANNRMSVAYLYRAMAKYDLAAQAYQKGLEIAEANHLDREMSRLLLGMAGLHNTLNDNELAMSFGLRALAMKDKMGDKIGPAQVLEILALAATNLRKADLAQQYYDAGMKAADETNDPYIKLMMRFNYSGFLVAKHDYAPAVPLLNETIVLAETSSRPAMAAHARTSLSELASRESRYQEALDFASPAVEFARRTEDHSLAYRACDALGIAQAGLKQDVEAEKSFRDALAAIETIRERIAADRDVVARFMEDKTQVYYHLIELLQRQGRDSDALAVAELSKARVVLDVLVRGNVDFSSSMTPADKQREAALLARLSEKRTAAFKGSATAAEVESARIEYRTFKSALYSSHPELRLRRADIPPASPMEMLAALPEPNAALLQFVVTKQKALLFAVTSEGGKPAVRSYVLDVKVDTLKADVARFRELIGSRNLGFRSLGGSLYKSLLAPAAAQLRGYRTLIIVPDGFLWQLPFQALEPVANRYLIEDKAIFYAPSFTVLHEMLKSKAAPRQPRVLAISATGLATTRREALGLRDIYGAANTNVLLDAEANESAVRKNVESYGVLHLAAHGVFQDRNPLASYLVLSKGSLDATAMMGLRLRAGMVVLSGCETGRGETGTGEGLIGMSWALFVAGSPTTVASQWKVDAASTSELMLQFHRGARGSGSKARAMQQASLAVMKMPQYRHPFYWSGFVVMGQGF